ncbi:MAG: PQQ-binding-like beta-propeller repeat protein [Treponema sp.]|jgi:outer membrane protein assembly factor BamB|nr:PQQ-binding-like beta-propeller repeat protein [Treponema sp.]
MMKRTNLSMNRVHFLFALLLILIPAMFSNAQTRAANQNDRIEVTKVPVNALPVWTRDITGSVSGKLFLQAESVVMAIDEGLLRSYGMYGTHLWDFDTRGSIVPYITRNPEGTTFVCNTDGTFMAVNRIGRELWRLDLSRPINHPAVIGWDGRVFITARNEISCRTGAGNGLWTYDMGSAVSVPPTLDRQGGIITALESKELLRISQFGVQERLSLKAIPSFIVPLKLENEYAYYLFYADATAEYVSFDDSAAKGSQLIRSSRPALTALPSAAEAYGDKIALAFKDGRVQLLSSAGRILWTGNSHETTAESGSANLAVKDASLIFDKRGVYLLSPRGCTAFAEDGRRRWLSHIDETMMIPGLSDEGFLYTCSKDEVFTMYKIDNKDSGWPHSMFGPAPEGRYGLDDPPPSRWASDNFRYNEYSIKDMIETIDEATRNGNVGEMEPEYVAYITEMTFDFLNSNLYSPFRPAVQVPDRVKLIRLLARMGSRETVSFLTKLFYRDKEPSIKAACCEAIGRIGVDPEGEAYGTFSFLLSPQNANLDPQALMAAISAVASLCRFSGPPFSLAGIRLLYTMSHMDYPPSVKRQVQRELDGLRKEGLDKPQRWDIKS